MKASPTCRPCPEVDTRAFMLCGGHKNIIKPKSTRLTGYLRATNIIIMKKYLFILAAALMAASCTTTTKTARTENIPYSMYNANVADLQVGERITYTYSPSKAIRRGGLANCKKAAIADALTQNGNADLLVEPQFVVSVRRNLLGSKVTSVTVTGRPAKYVNIHSLPDKVWTDPIFRGTKNATFYFGTPAHGAGPGCPMQK